MERQIRVPEISASVPACDLHPALTLRLGALPHSPTWSKDISI
jgi:hypothetical protein